MHVEIPLSWQDDASLRVQGDHIVARKEKGRSKGRDPRRDLPAGSLTFFSRRDARKLADLINGQ